MFNKAIMLMVVECEKYAVVLFDHLLVDVELIQGLLLFAEFFELRVHILRDDLFDLLQLGVLLPDELESLSLLRLVEADARSLLNEPQDLLGLHVDNLGDAALHDQKVRIIDIQFDRAKQGLDFLGGLRLPVDVVFRLRVLDGARHDNLVEVSVAGRRLRLVAIVEFDGDGGLGDSRVTLLVDKFLQLFSSHVRQLGDTQHEAEGIQDIRLPTAIQTGDRIEFLVKSYTK